ncbi:uncharacterized protein EV420DRAFT_1579763 [Desarmillaria tabescens]|uniref:Uncharacterized protein n=1 Tax=Armillaria tabescens TaxID=1929756 RepID=A0AA39MNY4_ARMTA|nr:uncharacterized protein EV420DRAFT_1579763 [Desarmillaria tabescens]KAK0441721.1 hypothetical protein EV420DRAFT_1579763 [Desarmillaria tabescens]
MSRTIHSAHMHSSPSWNLLPRNLFSMSIPYVVSSRHRVFESQGKRPQQHSRSWKGLEGQESASCSSPSLVAVSLPTTSLLWLTTPCPAPTYAPSKQTASSDPARRTVDFYPPTTTQAPVQTFTSASITYSALSSEASSQQVAHFLNHRHWISTYSPAPLAGNNQNIGPRFQVRYRERGRDSGAGRRRLHASYHARI